MFRKINDKIAIRATKFFGSMPMFWIFCIWAFLPLIPIFENYKETILYISSGFIQLVALPLLMVGQQLLNKKSEVRSAQDHITLNEQFKSLNDLILEIKDLHEDTHKLLKDKNDVV
jgi:hypothetical protein